MGLVVDDCTHDLTRDCMRAHGGLVHDMHHACALLLSLLHLLQWCGGVPGGEVELTVQQLSRRLDPHVTAGELLPATPSAAPPLPLLPPCPRLHARALHPHANGVAFAGRGVRSWGALLVPACCVALLLPVMLNKVVIRPGLANVPLAE